MLLHILWDAEWGYIMDYDMIEHCKQQRWKLIKREKGRTGNLQCLFLIICFPISYNRTETKAENLPAFMHNINL